MATNETHPQDEQHPYFSDQKCTNCEHNVGVPCDNKGKNIEMEPGMVMFCANCCEALELGLDRKIRRVAPRKLMQLIILRPNEMLRMFAAFQAMAKHQDNPR